MWVTSAGGRSGGALAIALAAFTIFFTIEPVRLIGSGFPGFFLWDNGTLVSFHLPSWTGAKAALPLNGGRIVGFEGGPFTSGSAVLDRAAALPIGTPLQYEIVSDGTTQTTAVPTMRLDATDWLFTFGNYLANAVFCFAIAVIAIALRPELAAARALAVVMVLLGGVLVLSMDLFSAYRFVAGYFVAQAATPAAIVALLLVFPVPRLDAALRRRAIYSMAGLALAVGLVNVVLFRRDPEAARALTLLAIVAIGVTGVATVMSFGEATLRAKSAVARLQAGVVFSGALVSFLIPSILMIAFSILGWTFSFTWVTAFIFLFPISVLYAIVRHELFDAERFIRVTLGYAIASAAVVLGYASTLTIAESLLASGAFARSVASFVVLVGLAIAFDPLRRAVQRQIDRVFFRSDVDAARVLETSMAALVDLRDERKIRAALAERLTNALTLRWADAVEPDATLPRETALETAIALQDNDYGALVAGPKRSGAPFSERDRELAAALAAQGALAIHNARAAAALTATQEALIRSERLAVLGEFAGAVAHGIRNPLSGIRATAEIARDETNDPGTAETLVGVLSEADRLDRRIRSLLELSRPDELQPRLLRVDEMLHSVQRTLQGRAERQSAQIEVDAAPGGRIRTDPDHLEELLLELVGNALQALSPDGGRIRLEAEHDAAELRMRVRDTGNGIPEPVRNRIFDLFFTTRSDGNGVGLAAVKRSAERLGGRVRLVSAEPGDTCFEVVFPSAPQNGIESGPRR